LRRATARTLLLLLLCCSALPAARTLSPVQRIEASSADAAAETQSARAALQQSLLDLSNPWTVMCVAAHPDDEDGATLTVLRRKYGVHTVTVFSTYGEGGQNATGPELYEELGAIRARETLAAAVIQGSEPTFLALRDFGFSKSADEAFRIWNHDVALKRMVLKIRTLHPDVIITNHDTTSGHGHHQATGRLVIEAFAAAADPARFPEQLREPGVTVWQAQRLFVRVNYENGTGSKALEEKAAREGRIVTVNPNERDAVRGSTYAEQALEALHQHASQGPWPATVPKEGAPVIRYRLALEANDAAALPPHAETVLDGLRLPKEIVGRFIPPVIDGRPLIDFIDDRERLLAALVALRKASPEVSLFSIFDQPRFQLMSERLNRALAATSGFALSLTPRNHTVTPDAPVYFTLHIEHAGALPLQLHDIITGCWQDFHSLDSHKYKVPSSLNGQYSQDVPEATYAPPEAFINVPRAEHLYDGHTFGQQCIATASLEIDGARFKLAATTLVDVAPAVEIRSITPSPLVLTPDSGVHSPTVTFRLINHQDAPFAGKLNVQSASKRIASTLGSVNLAAGETHDLSVTMPSLSGLRKTVVDDGRGAGSSLTFSVTRGQNPHPITQQSLPLVWSDARVAPHLRVGYVRSFDDTLRNALSGLGVEAKELTIDDVRGGELKSFDTIIIDNRGYQAHPELIAANPRLLEYVHAGGTLIVFYHKTGEWNPDPKKNRPQLAPYPITLGSERVTDETAPVTFTQTRSPLLNFPNHIGQQDFEGWIQERGLYYPKEWDARYEAVLSTNDPGAEPLRGGLLAATYGQGRYIYTSMVWYRQLRAGVPGAYRFFANMISYGHTGQEAKPGTTSGK
jgi:LmbE family N-acetylglucosaminyl deacetylase